MLHVMVGGGPGRRPTIHDLQSWSRQIRRWWASARHDGSPARALMMRLFLDVALAVRSQPHPGQARQHLVGEIREFRRVVDQ
jgi:hypothetical protein